MAVPNSPMTFTAAGETVAVSPSAGFVLDGGKILIAGGAPVTVDGKQLSLAPSASVLIVDGSITSNLASPQTTHPLALTIGSDVLTANAATQFLLASGNVLTPGGQVIQDGTTINLDSQGSIAVVNGVTQTLAPPTITPLPHLTIGGTVYEANLASTFEIAGQELTPGGSITVDGTKIALAEDATAVVINGVTKTLDTVPDSTPTPGTTSPAVVNVAGETFTVLDGSTFANDEATLTPGGVITIGTGDSATTISLGNPGSNNIVINGATSTLNLGSINTPQLLTIDGQIFAADASGAFGIHGQTLSRGGNAITFTTNGVVETLSLNSNGDKLIINGMTSTLEPASSPEQTANPLTINDQLYTALNGAGGASYIIAGQTLTEGGAITYSEGGEVETVSLSPGGTVAIINGVSSTITPASTITAAPELTIDGQIVTAIDGRGTTYLVSGKLLTPGGSVVFEGVNGVETVSLSPDGDTLVEQVSGATTTSELPKAFVIAQTAAPVITIGDESFVALPGPGPSYLLPDGQTLHPGGPLLTETIHGSVYIVSLSPSATILLVEGVGANGVVTATETETLFPATITRGRGTATITTNTTPPGGASVASTQTQAAVTSSSGKDPASLQGLAAYDKKIGGTLAAGALGVALCAVLL